MLLSAGNIPPYCVVAEFIGVALFAFLGGACDANSVSTGVDPTKLPAPVPEEQLRRNVVQNGSVLSRLCGARWSVW